jgi:hypothetical protein
MNKQKITNVTRRGILFLVTLFIFNVIFSQISNGGDDFLCYASNHSESVQVNNGPRKERTGKRRVRGKYLSKDAAMNADSKKMSGGSKFYAEDTVKGNADKIGFSEIRCENQVEYGKCSAKLHIGMDYPIGNSAVLDEAIKSWLCECFESLVPDSAVKIRPWISDKYPYTGGMILDGSWLLRYYNEFFVSHFGKRVLSFGSCSDSIEVRIVGENDKYISYSFHAMTAWHQHPDSCHEGFRNVTFRKRDGVRMEWNIVRQEMKAELRVILKNSFKSYAETMTEGRKDDCDSVLNDYNSLFPLPQASPILTDEGMEFDYSSFSDYGNSKVRAGASLTIPYNTIRRCMKPDAIVLITDSVGKITEKGITYMLKGDSARALSFSDETITDINIPECIVYGDESFRVYAIDENCFKNKKEIQTVTIPDSVGMIGANCFSGCSSLKAVKLPKNLQNLEAGTFRHCYSLTDVMLPQSITAIGDECFSECRKLSKVAIPYYVKSLGKECFYNCETLQSVSILSNLASIGDGCFKNCFALEGILLPASLTALSNELFMNCSKLHTFTIPEHVTSIGRSCFEGCISIAEILLPKGLSSLGASCLKKCSGINMINIPSSVAAIGDGCFNGCKSLGVVVCNWMNPANISVNVSAFQDISVKPVLFIPEKAKKYYKDVLPWKNFSSMKYQDPKAIQKAVMKAIE